MPIRYDKDPYSILGVSRTASDAEIKQVYRRLARQYHPDLNQNPRAAERMKEINWAYSILGNSKERLAYDLWRDSVARASSSPPPRTQQWATYSSPQPRPRPQTRRGGMGFSGILLFYAIYTLISSLLRNDSYRQPIYLSSFNEATQTAQAERVNGFILTFSGTQSTSLPFYSLTESARQTQTAIAESKNIRDEVLPGTQAWEWIDQYLADYHLTTPQGLTDEVTAVTWDQIQKAYIIKTQQYGTFIISTYGGQISVGQIPLLTATSTAAP